MHETPQQYTERILTYQRGSVPLDVLESTPRKLAKLLRAVPKRKLAKRPAPDRWSVAEILAHLADSELVFGFRLRLTIGSNGTPIQAFDQDVWSEFSRYPTQNPGESFDAYRVLRKRNIALLRTIPKELWENFGMHTERGKETVTRMTEMMAGHDINHATQIEAMLKRGQSRGRE
jgi:hypothetical protein